MDLKDTESYAYFFTHIPMKQIILEVGKKKYNLSSPPLFCVFIAWLMEWSKHSHGSEHIYIHRILLKECGFPSLQHAKISTCLTTIVTPGKT